MRTLRYTKHNLVYILLFFNVFCLHNKGYVFLKCMQSLHNFYKIKLAENLQH